MPKIKKGAVYIALFIFGINLIVGLVGLGLIKGLLYALFNTMVCLILYSAYIFVDYICLKRAFKKYGHVDYELSQHRQIEILYDRKKGLDYAVEALQHLKGIRHIEIDKLRGIIEAETKLYCRNSFSLIRIEVREEINGKSVMVITSNPLRKTVVFDQGRNYINVEKICHFLGSFTGRSQYRQHMLR